MKIRPIFFAWICAAAYNGSDPRASHAGIL